MQCCHLAGTAEARSRPAGEARRFVLQGSKISALAIGADAALLNQFLRFPLVGVVGLLVNVGSAYAMRGGLGLYGGAAAFVAAARVTWLANRCWSFRDRARVAASRQRVLYFGVSLIGFVFYYASYIAPVALVPLCRLSPALPVAAGRAAVGSPILRCRAP